MLIGFLITTTWRDVGLRMEQTASCCAE